MYLYLSNHVNYVLLILATNILSTAISYVLYPLYLCSLHKNGYHCPNFRALNFICYLDSLSLKKENNVFMDKTIFMVLHGLHVILNHPEGNACLYKTTLCIF